VIFPLAHAGHWFAGLLYLAPVLIVVGFLGVQWWRDRNAEPGAYDDEEEDLI
jgi:hypothetical protein